MPSFVLTSGRKFSTTTSAFSASRLNTSRPPGSFRLSVIALLLRCKFWKSEPWRGPPGCSPPLSSSSASILMTLAPQSASCRTQVGPERTRVRSSTVKRERACEARGKGIDKPSFSGFRVGTGRPVWLNQSGADFQLLVQRPARGGHEGSASAFWIGSAAAREGGNPAPQDYGPAPE